MWSYYYVQVQFMWKKAHWKKWKILYRKKINANISYVKESRFSEMKMNPSYLCHIYSCAVHVWLCVPLFQLIIWYISEGLNLKNFWLIESISACFIYNFHIKIPRIGMVLGWQWINFLNLESLDNILAHPSNWYIYSQSY